MSENYWWELEDDTEAGEETVRVAQALMKAQKTRLANAFRHHRLYEGLSPQSMVGFASIGYIDSRAVDEIAEPRNPLNIVASTIDSVVSQVAEDDVHASFLTDGGTYDEQRKAKLLEQFSDGAMYASGWHELAPQVLVDACQFGTGIAKIFEVGGRFRAEKRILGEVLVDDLDGRNGEPQQMMERRLVSKSWLRGQSAFKGKRAIIDLAEVVSVRPLAQDSIIHDTVEVFEAWHLPSEPGAKDGKRVLALTSGVLAVEPWTRPDFPFVFQHFKKPTIGFWGKGLAEAVALLQELVNRNLMAARESMDAATFKILIQAGSKIVKSQINNKIAGAVEYVGQPPTFIDTPPLFEQFTQFIDWCIKEAFAMAGVSQMSSQSLKPAGLDSGAALEAYANIQSVRFSTLSKAYNELHVAVSKKFITTAREASKAGDISVTTPGEKFLKRIKWSDIDLEDDEFRCRVWPANLLPKTPAGRLQYTQQLLKGALITPQQGRRLLSFPDVDAVLDGENAMEEAISWTIGQMLDHSKPMTPDPVLDLDLAATRVHNALLNAMTQMPANDERLNLLRNWLQIADAQKKALAAQSAPPPGAPDPGSAGPPAGPPPGPGAPPMPSTPQGRPMPAPVSDLLPQGG